MLRIAESFYSIQGEGKTMGTPSLFLRMQGCNLLCGNPDLSKYIDEKNVDNMEKRSAKWICDTIPVWIKGKIFLPEEIVRDWKEKGWYDRLLNGAHLIVTGGEPLIQQEELINLFKLLPKNTYIEVETNGTILPIDDFDYYISQYNCSPKLSNSGMFYKKRYKKNVLRWHNENIKSYFKFVVLDEDDINELIDDFIHELNIKNNKIYLMPGATTRKELINNVERVVDLCKKNGWNYSSRLQLEIWDKVTGV